jgi:cytochrome c oxidase subunit 2
MNGKLTLGMMPTAASDYAGRVDLIFYAMTAMTAFFVILIFGLIFAFAMKYRRQKRMETPPETVMYLPVEILWTAVPLIIVMGLFVWGSKLFLEGYSYGPKDAYEVYVTGRQWMWKFQHPLGRREINEVHLPTNQPVRFIMVSEDVIHDVYIPALRLKHDVLPQRYTSMWFNADRPGTYHLFCAEYCGTKHSAMVGQAIMMEPAAFETWMGGAEAQDSPAQAGAALLTSLGCRACHVPAGQQAAGQQAMAPALEGLYGSRVPLVGGGSATADENYIRESVIEPKAKVVAGFQPIMPSYAGRITEDELIQVLAYLKSVGSSK